MKKEIVKEYIEKVKEKNAKKGRTETRPCFFFVPKLNEMMLMEKTVIPRAKVSDVYLKVLKRNKHENYDLSKLPKSKRIQFFMENIEHFDVYPDVSVGTMLSYIDKFDYVDFLSPVVNHLSVLKVHPYYRGLGLSKELINELVNETAYYGYPLIKARMSALDYTINPNEEETKVLNEKIHLISPERQMSDKVDIHTLAQIYKSLGFNVSKNYVHDHDITMNVRYDQIKKKDRYPDNFLEFTFNNDTDILVR